MRVFLISIVLSTSVLAEEVDTEVDTEEESEE